MPKKKLCKKPGHSIHNKAELEDIVKFQSYLGRKGYQILVFSSNTDHKEPIYKGPPGTHALVLVYHDGHYDVITKLPSFLRRNSYYYKCNKSDDWKVRHRCAETCNCCKLNTGCEINKSGSWMHCDQCNQYFNNKKRFNNHLIPTGKKNPKSTCDHIKKCKKYHMIVDWIFLKNITVLRSIAEDAEYPTIKITSVSWCLWRNTKYAILCFSSLWPVWQFPQGSRWRKRNIGREVRSSSRRNKQGTRSKTWKQRTCKDTSTFTLCRCIWSAAGFVHSTIQSQLNLL